MTDVSANNKHIAKNTMLLYFRMLILMLIALYSSRVVLNALGVEDYGIFNVVGGLISMFSIISGAISVAITRFITFELGKGDKEKLNLVFSSAVIIQLIMCVAIIVLAETVGLWFLNTHMSFPESRAFATNVIYQVTVFTFCITLTNIPYNACIIAHEKMRAFAYITIAEAVFKLLAALAIVYVSFDKLISYTLLLLLGIILTRIMYMVYCLRHFEEAHIHFKFDKSVLHDMFVYSGWTYIGASSALLRDAGGNILINVFYGPTANAARGIGVQVQSAVSQFATNFMTALNPQIVKNFAMGNHEYVNSLLFYGARFSYYVMLIFVIPIIINTPYILNLWLGQVPEYSVQFVRLALLFSISEAISQPLVTAASASGNIKRYQLLVGGLQLMNFPLSLLLLYLGLPPYTVYAVAICVSQLCLAGRLYILRGMIKLSAIRFLRQVYVNIIAVTIVSLIIPIIFQPYYPTNFVGLALSCVVCMLSVCLSVMYVGANKGERAKLFSFFKEKIKTLRK